MRDPRFLCRRAVSTIGVLERVTLLCRRFPSLFPVRVWLVNIWSARVTFTHNMRVRCLLQACGVEASGASVMTNARTLPDASAYDVVVVQHAGGAAGLSRRVAALSLVEHETLPKLISLPSRASAFSSNAAPLCEPLAHVCSAEPLFESILRALRPDGKLFVQADGQQSAVEHALLLAGFVGPAAGPANTVAAQKPAYEVRRAALLHGFS